MSSGLADAQKSAEGGRSPPRALIKLPHGGGLWIDVSSGSYRSWNLAWNLFSVRP